MKKSTKKAWKKVGKAFLEGAKETGKEVGGFLGEGVKTAFKEGKRIVVGPTTKEQLESLKREKSILDIQRQRAEIAKARAEFGYRSRGEQFRDFTRGAEEKLEQTILPKRRSLLIKPKRYKEDIIIKQRRPLSNMLSSPVLRI